ncbi:uncharacterized protein PgNI_01507 [Pyricularia grisea]|uniref:Uncharacterized protein n=1 Tax=Pyricularia grisea TaxID=148305 RepID=A0A6P8BM41_PYRGI|nr:uncharacterized protein PgNI_01507 [Pyricularia grisea]TLD17662.1 hypothetical protein PgNI_01507 [Pyricularia grisea]
MKIKSNQIKSNQNMHSLFVAFNSCGLLPAIPSCLWIRLHGTIIVPLRPWYRVRPYNHFSGESDGILGTLRPRRPPRAVHLVRIAAATLLIAELPMGPARPEAVHSRAREVGRSTVLAILSPLVPEPVHGRGVDHKGSHDQLGAGPCGSTELAFGVVVVDREADGGDDDDKDSQHEEGNELNLALQRRREHLVDNWQR